MPDLLGVYFFDCLLKYPILKSSIGYLSAHIYNIRNLYLLTYLQVNSKKKLCWKILWMKIIMPEANEVSKVSKVKRKLSIFQ